MVEANKKMFVITEAYWDTNYNFNVRYKPVAVTSDLGKAQDLVDELCTNAGDRRKSYYVEVRSLD